jgi:O-acetyl-ADP-ribose deacetylase (regulator of RNase III)
VKSRTRRAHGHHPDSQHPARTRRGDITEAEVEAFVFDITEDAKLGSGFGGAIQQRGGIVIQKELDEIGSVPTGEAVVTQAGILNAEYIIHVNGPKFREEDEEGKLERSVKSVLARAEEKGIKQLAFPPIGTGMYQVPMDLCATVMVEDHQPSPANGSGLEEVLIVVQDPREIGPFEAKCKKEHDMHESSSTAAHGRGRPLGRVDHHGRCLHPPPALAVQIQTGGRQVGPGLPGAQPTLNAELSTRCSTCHAVVHGEHPQGFRLLSHLRDLPHRRGCRASASRS